MPEDDEDEISLPKLPLSSPWWDSKSLQDVLWTSPPPSFSCPTVVAVASFAVVAVDFALVVDDDDANDDEIHDDDFIVEVGKKPGAGTARLGLCELSPIALLVDILDLTPWILALILPTAAEIPLLKLEEACREELVLDCPCSDVRNSLRKSPSSFSSSSWEAVKPPLPPSSDDWDPQLEVKLKLRSICALLNMDWLLPLLQQIQPRSLPSSRIFRWGSRTTGLADFEYFPDFLSLCDIPRPPSHKSPGLEDWTLNLGDLCLLSQPPASIQARQILSLSLLAPYYTPGWLQNTPQVGIPTIRSDRY
jgi:hypothetical protein